MPRVHGGPDGRGVPAHDFSTNANGCGPCLPALAAVQAADGTRYPDPAYGALRERLAQWHGVAPQRIVIAASGSEFVFRITAWAAGAGRCSVSVPPHGYGDYAHAARACGLKLVSADESALAWACDPASPLGSPDDQVRSLIARGALVVLDRAYEPLRLTGALGLDPSLLDRLWQLWTPNKALGLTGVRGAYAIAPSASEAAVAQLEALAPSWPLGAHGQAMLQAWCEPAVQEWLARSLDVLRDWKQRQLALCESLGWACQPGQANFFTCDPGLGPDLAAPLERLLARGVKLRDCASFGLPGRVRLGVLPPASQDALAAAWGSL
ncbi:MAG: aminotransferase class I/II-fold pyridoxal phosphate-dependent enzyme [Ramlibacter sp.]|nr:aminotransferase class I/II-fold pyridoxal phosphate-dependent enzyme [Ramlibacter sp.]